MQASELDAFQYLEPLNERQSVFLVRNERTGELFAARKLGTEQAETYRKLLHASIPHTSAVRYLAEDVGNTYLEFEDYIPGVSLDTYLKGNIVDEHTAINIAIQLCEALTALHHLDIVHRDIKPANVLLTQQHQAYLIDFDISRITKPSQGQDTELLGTRGYAAPEQFGFRQTDARADLYSLGVLLNVMVTGHFPHEQLSKGTLGSIIARCVSIDPADRYPNAEELYHALVDLAPNVPKLNQASAVSDSPTESPSRKSSAIFNAFRRFHLNRVPGFRSGNLFFETIALLFYFFAAIMAVVFMTLAVQSLDNLILITAFFLIGIGWYLFVFDLLGVRSKIYAVEKHRGKPLYVFYCGCAMAMWFILIFAVLFLIFGMRGSAQ